MVGRHRLVDSLSLLAAALGVLYVARRAAARVPQARRRRKCLFVRSAGQDYGYASSEAGHIDSWRKQHFPPLLPPLGVAASHGTGSVVYLDYAGAALPPAPLLAHVLREASAAVVGNPHSTGPAAGAASRAMECAKQLVLEQLCGEQAAEWEIVWTSGATAALRLVADTFPFERGSVLLYQQSAHTSVVGMRGPAAAAGATCWCARGGPGNLDDLVPAAAAALSRSAAAANGSTATHLCVVSGECNLTGERAVASELASANSALGALAGGSKWYMMLDGAKAASGDLRLVDTSASLCCVSLYKMFGEPCGLGALLIRRDVLPLLRKRPLGYFGGGSVAAVLPAADAELGFFNPPKPLAAALEDGTPNFRGALAVEPAMERLRALGGPSAVQRHATVLAAELARRLSELRHAGGRRAVVLYGPWEANLAKGGGRLPSCSTVAFNLLRADGSHVGYAEVTRLAALHTPSIQLRSGCCCNPGGCQALLNLAEEDVREAAGSGKQCGDERDLSPAGLPLGLVRASLGVDSIWEDVDALVLFVEQTFVRIAAPLARADSHANRLPPTLSELHVYPIKSCAGCRVKRWAVDRSSGRLLYDREWGVAALDGRILRASTHPTMTLLQPHLDLTRRVLTVTNSADPMQAPLVLALGHTSSAEPCGTCSECRGWLAPVGARDLARMAACTTAAEELADHYCASSMRGGLSLCGAECDGDIVGGSHAQEWLTRALGVPCRLVRCASSSAAGFANEAPLLLATTTAVSALNEVLDGMGAPTVCASRFRANLVVNVSARSAEAFPEFSWASIALANGALRLRVVGPCTRCTMVELDPQTGARHGSVLSALTSLCKARGRIVFGAFCEVDACAVAIPAGDASTDACVASGDVVVLEQGERIQFPVM